jgi:peptide/nickel transport system permease protein
MKTAGKISIAVLLAISLLSVFAPIISGYDPDIINLDRLREPPSLQHPLGTDNKGRDILSRILHGGRISLSITLTAALLSVGTGLVAGLCAGFFGGKIDTAIMALVDLILSFPALFRHRHIILFRPVYTVLISIVSVDNSLLENCQRTYPMEDAALRRARSVQQYEDSLFSILCPGRPLLL